jgi:hypothetical protein
VVTGRSWQVGGYRIDEEISVFSYSWPRIVNARLAMVVDVVLGMAKSKLDVERWRCRTGRDVALTGVPILAFQLRMLKGFCYRYFAIGRDCYVTKSFIDLVEVS